MAASLNDMLYKHKENAAHSVVFTNSYEVICERTL